MEPETVDALKADAERFLDPDRDPIVPLYRRWKALWETTYKLVDECPTGNWDAPELSEAEIEMYKIEGKMITLVPVSIEGLVALADYLWLKEGPSARVGTEKWCEELTRIEYLPIRRIRHGAALMAGVSLSEVPGAKPI
ncbi:hypothetical protein [Pseudohalocynthiibacter sp. F2068]|jgi:hypothetical protein|uniref:hypothetical protein n=1 Tax=Pseudohalocynthiibacter sp. F2068 TaxID=2926418 RepID=UPI001FF5F0CA|nr:hypothetical protein [Pseudohalocynthiibacter sp. F2068]MCK0102547.1 hypothetical protein [Pseudohalocynthiibacter sp. F2068]